MSRDLPRMQGLGADNLRPHLPELHRTWGGWDVRRTGPDEATKDAIYARARFRCERCGDDEGPFAIHHRRPRAMGGTRREDANSPANLVLLDDGCHRQVESWRQEALRDGWVVRQTVDPSLAPVDVHGRGLVYLTGVGTYVPLTDPETAA